MEIKIADEFYETGKLGENITSIIAHAIIKGKQLVLCGENLYVVNIDHSMHTIYWRKIAEV